MRVRIGRAAKSFPQVASKRRIVEPNIDDLKALITRKANEGLCAESRALELAVAAIEVLRDRGAITGADLLRLAEFLGFDSEAVANAWQTRGSFDIEKTRYALDEPIAKVVRLD
jgi:hypothetical protein